MKPQETANQLIHLWQQSRILGRDQRDLAARYADRLHTLTGGRNDLAATIHLLVKEAAAHRDETAHDHRWRA